MDSIGRTSVHKRTPMRFLVDGLQVWASYLDQNNDGPFGVRFLWTEDALDCGPQGSAMVAGLASLSNEVRAMIAET